MSAPPMKPSVAPFYITGGTLPADASSYVERQADKDLLAGLLASEYCYVLNTRQMGKSSLMVRTAVRLREAGVTVAILDLTAIGQNLTPEQWYDGLLLSLASQLDLEDELEKFWEENPRLGPMQRFFGAIELIVLPNLTPNPSPSQGEGSTKSPLLTKEGVGGGRLVIFVDEIDAVRSLPFPADEFFAGIRECYNRRVQGDQLKRLTFCLLGVATPADLITETRMSPFNIGRRIMVTDFTPEEATPLAHGLQGGDGVLDRVLYWTSGHPYMTQRLCRAIAEQPGANSDAVCDQLFLSKQARDTDDNLAFVRNRLLRSEVDLASLLDLYTKVRSGKPVKDDETDPLAPVLRLSGVVRVEDGLLKVRNRIYDRVFDREWVLAHMPDAELRRQRAAYRRGVLRTVSVSAIILLIMAVLTGVALRQRQIASGATERALGTARFLRANLYAADMGGASQALEENNLVRARNLLDLYRPRAGETDLRTFEWGYLSNLCLDQSLWWWSRPEAQPGYPSVSPDGQTIAMVDWSREKNEGRILLYDMKTRKETSLFATLKGVRPRMPVFSPNGRFLAVRCENRRVLLYEVASHRLLNSYEAPPTFYPQVDTAFSPDGKLLAVAGSTEGVTLWNVATHRRVAVCTGQNSVAFSPDGRLMATMSDDPKPFAIYLRDMRKGTTRTVPLGTRPVCVTFSPIGQLMAVGLDNGIIQIRSTSTGESVRNPFRHRSWVYGVAFSRDGKWLASASADTTVRIWELSTGKERSLLRGHLGEVASITFTRDFRNLLTTGPDGVKLWDASPKQVQGLDAVWPPSLDGSLYAVNVEGALSVWDTETSRRLHALPRSSTGYIPLAFSGDRSILYLQSESRGATRAASTHASTPKSEPHLSAWNLATGRVRDFSLNLRAGQPFTSQSPDGKLLAFINWEETHPIEILDLTTGNKVASIPGQHAAFSADSQWMAVSVGHEGFQVYETRNWKPVSPLLTPEYAARNGPLAFSPDRKMLVTGGNLGVITFWDTNTWKQTPSSTAYSGKTSAVAFSPDGLTLVTNGGGQTQFWNTRSWRLTMSLRTGEIWVAQFSPDGAMLTTYGITNRRWRTIPFR